MSYIRKQTKHPNIFDTKAYTPADDITLIHSGDHFFDTLLQIINGAKQEIHFQTYIFEEDETGTSVAEALIIAAKRGVKVYLVCDGYGSRHLSERFITALTIAGVFFQFFSPGLHFGNFNIGRRLHHKIVVIDKVKAIIGGINIANKYKGDPEKLPWLDFALFVNGDACKIPQRICQMIVDKRLNLKTNGVQILNKELVKGNYLIRFRQNDFFKRKNQISNSYLQAIREAEHSISIIASYFLPGLKMRKAMAKAAKRGVTVKIILSGISDVNVMRISTRYLYNFLLRNNIFVYEYSQTVLHAKVAIVDSKWVTIGSFNLNHLSTYASVELNADVLNNTFAQKFEQHFFEVATNQSQKIDVLFFKNSIFLKFNRWLIYNMVRIGINILSVFPNFTQAFTRRLD
ncbi:MAG: phospholipase D-like domain-containing protein [Ferruginibacter sp.]|nr:phospholipase D-like domain-containing protein [Ferruginibacter sp.]